MKFITIQELYDYAKAHNIENLPFGIDGEIVDADENLIETYATEVSFNKNSENFGIDSKDFYIGAYYEHGKILINKFLWLKQKIQLCIGIDEIKAE
jgi:hypothetical protein